MSHLLEGADRGVVREFSEEINELHSVPHLLEMNRKTIETCMRWDDFCARLFHAYQDLALAEAEAASPAEDLLSGRPARG